ncbi:MAG TPA: threonine-phosphate decarboxylase CobD [Methylocella sp.]|nr:threonine-phosphate decarboxylase CobD [Methylocella sp.]
MTKHGGAVNAARLAFPGAPEPWLDLSTGVNPYVYPYGSVPCESLTQLPDPHDLQALESAAASAFAIPSHAGAVAAPGTQAIINWLPQLFPARRAGILGFSYSGHAAAWERGGAEVPAVDDLSELAAMDVAIIVNPNNPDGRLVPAGELCRLAQALGRRNGLLIVDEAFIDFLEPEVSLAPRLPDAGAIVLRSFGKCYGLPGLRLGFAIAPKPMAEKLRAALGPWPVPGPAIGIGLKALADAPWRASARERLVKDAAKLDQMLAAAGFAPIGGTHLFRLAAHEHAQDWHARLARAGILARRFEARPHWLRFGIPGGEMAWRRLRAALGLPEAMAPVPLSLKCF